MKRKSSWLLVIACVAMALTPTGPVSAHITPCQGFQYSFDGFENYSHNHGAKSNIETYRPDLCGSSGHAAAWVMLYGFANCDGYAQAGYAHVPNQPTRWFAEGSRILPTVGCNGDFTRKWGEEITTPGNCPGTLTCPEFVTSYWSGVDDHIHMLVNGQQLHETGFDPLNWWTTPFVASFMGETTHVESNMPGDPGDNVDFTKVRGRTSQGDWVVRDLKRWEENVCRYRQDFVDNGHFKIWTQPVHDYCP